MIPAFPIYQSPQYVEEQRTEIVFSEKNLRQGFLDINPTMLEYFKDEQYRNRFENISSIYMSNKLRELIKLWEDETAFSSSVTEIINSEYFRNILSYGDEIVPSILQEIEREPSKLVWALNLITNKNISDNPISITEASKLWVKWGKKYKLID